MHFAAAARPRLALPRARVLGSCVAAWLCLVTGGPAVADGTESDTDASGRLVRLIEGDILVDAVAPARRAVAFRRDRTWPDGVMPVWIDPAIGSASRIIVRDAIEVWNGVPGVRIRELDERPSDDLDHVRFDPGEGCASWVGRRGGAQSLWVAPRCNLGSVMHEIGHALGLEHEHTRSDRDQWITIHWDNIQPAKRHNFDVAPDGARLLGNYDYDSLMHYGGDFFSRDGALTIVPLDPQARIGQRNGPSAGDIAAMAQLYGTDLALVADLFADDAPAQLDEAGDRPPNLQPMELAVTIANDGDNGAHDVVVNIDWPAGWRLADAAPGVDDWQCDQAGRCTLDHLPAGALSRLVMAVERPPMEPFVEPALAVRLSSATADARPDNDQTVLRPVSSGGGELVFASDPQALEDGERGLSGASGRSTDVVSVGGSGGLGGSGWPLLLGIATLGLRRRLQAY